MRKPFDGTFRQTQAFNDECCRESYKKFGLSGHNGLDYGCPTGTKILAPHDGKVIESTLDPKGYGIYVKIENSIEGSVLAHLREARVGVGDGVKEGDLVGYSDNSGNSTGPHLHWGYYRFPRDRQNGFAGFIDQTPYIGTGSPDLTLQTELNTCRIDRDGNHNDRMALYEELGFDGVFIRQRAVDEIKRLRSVDKDYNLKVEQNKIANDQVTTLEQKVKNLEDAHTKFAAESTQTIQDQGREIDKLSSEVQRLSEATTAPPLTGFKKLIYDLFIR